ncbi:DNA primase [Xanthomonas phage P4]|uniref:DNA primase n=1 Tax=Xanthomonas phage P4 TaxID=3003372 RepID=A0AAE9VI55_9CAUD|nr:DNA primase [Xanthomonas phage GF2]WAX24131.1 DNA primase [Xanthomonas phage GF1]WAX24193.1 DNA primase [Xanthomonas phage P4]WAX24217.1 DNA primase [Xanthomonas phage S3]
MSDTLPDNDWLPHAERLPVGGRTRVAHECGEGTPLLISREHDKSTAYCFRCGGTGFKREHESIEAKLARIHAEQTSERLVRATVELPEPRVYDTREWPLDAKVWFFKQGLSLRMIGELELYWCPSIGRVVLPIMEGDRTVYWTARSTTRQPKWLTPNVPKDGLVVRYGVGKGDTIVLCEDPLSAYKVGLVTEAWSLLGTKLHNKAVVALVGSGKRVAVWLDDDRGRSNGSNPGQEAATKIAARLRAFGLDVRNIKSPHDPKYHPPDYIQEKLR